MSEKIFAGIDLGGTKIYTAVADFKGRLLSELILPTGAERGPSAVIEDLVASVNRALLLAGRKRRDLFAVGIGTPGPVNFSTGIVADPPNLPGWRNVPLRKILSSRIGARTEVDNDANLAALAEARFGAASGLTEVVYITASTGVGGGIICNGRLYRGADGAAGEVGHMTVYPCGPRCNCGKSGCLEAVASGTAFFKKNGYSTEEAVKRAKSGDEKALEHISELAGWLGIGLANIANIFNPQAIVVGGGLSNMGTFLFKPLREAVKKHGFSIAGRNVKILRSKLGRRVGVLGAVALALEG